MHHDVIIIGAGPAGLCLAKALCDLDRKVARGERQARAAIAAPAVDGRAIGHHFRAWAVKGFFTAFMLSSLASVKTVWGNRLNRSAS